METALAATKRGRREAMKAKVRRNWQDNDTAVISVEFWIGAGLSLRNQQPEAAGALRQILVRSKLVHREDIRLKVLLDM